MPMTAPTVDFVARWAVLSDQRSPLCLGVAPSSKWLANWRLPDDIGGARRYCEHVLEAAGESLAAVKVQTSFFARFGGAGLELLRRFTDQLHAQGTLVLLDVKIGDADDTMDSYAQLCLGPQSVLGGDAVSAQCYMGFESLHPLLRRADALGAVVFVLVRTSNHAADSVQHARQDDLSVAADVATAVSAWNAAGNATAGAPGAAGAVVGARSPESGELYRLLPDSLVEVPGLGRPDRSTEEILAAAAALGRRALFTVTSGVLAKGPDADGLRSALSFWRSAVR